jgi:tetratricopeptide (TPR) repeat protein
MQQRWNSSLFGRLLLVLGVIILLGITPRPHAQSLQFHQVYQDLEKGLFDKAALLTAEIARQIPWRSDLWQRAGDYAWQAGDLQAIIRYLEQAALYGNISPDRQLRLVDAYLFTGEVNKAEHRLQNILEGKPTVDILIRLFQVHRLQKDYPATLADIQAIYELEPKNANLAYMAGLLQMVLNPDQALSFLEEASNLNDAFTPTISAIENSLLLAHISSDPVQALMTHGQILAALQEWELAGEAFHQATLIEPNNAAAWAFLGEARQHANGTGSFYMHLYPLQYSPMETSPAKTANEDGYAELQKALALAPRLVTGHVFLSLYWSRQQRYDLALDSIETAISLQPKESTLYSQKGSIQAMLGDLSGALESYQSAVKFSENDPQTRQLLISFCIAYEYQVKEVALPAVRKLLQSEALDPVALDLAGQVFYLLNNPAAQIYLEKALAQDANYAPAHLHLGLFYLQQGNRIQARDELLLAKSLAESSPTGDQAQRLLETYFPGE